MAKLVNRAYVDTATTGTGTITLGSPLAGQQSFSDAGVIDGEIVRYIIEDGADWEIGTGTYTASGTTLSRSVDESSNSGAAINLTGNAKVFISPSASDIVQPDATQTLTNKTLTSPDINGGTIDGAVIGGSTPAAVSGTTGTFSGDLTIADKIIHSGDTNTAIRFPAADTVTVETNGAERLRVTSAGNVGIGTGGPASIVGGTDTSPVLSIGGTDITLTTGDKAGSLSFITNDPSYTATYADGVTGEIASIAESAVGAAYGLAIYTGTTVGANRAERMRITSDGNVGIGTSSPATALDVNGDVTITDKIIHSGDTNTSIRFPAADTFTVETNGAERLRVTSAGAVGIGTTSPIGRLEVIDSSTGRSWATTSVTELLVERDGTCAIAIVANSANDSQLRFSDSDSETAGRLSYSHSADALVFFTDEAERMRITSTGDVGIGTSSPNAASIVDAQSTTKGVRFPNMTTTQKNAIANVAGNVVFDTTLGKLCVNSGSGWETITSI
jgi:hypothetical protein